MFRADDIRTIIQAGTYPYVLKFLAQKQIPSQRFYPSVEVSNVQPEGTDEKVDVTTETNRFEVVVFLRYGFPLDVETQNLFDIEKEILSELEAAVLGNNTITLETKKWQRSEIADNPMNVHGIQSTLTVMVQELKSTTGDGVLGAQMTLTLPGLADMPLLDKPIERETETNEIVYDSALNRKALSPISDVHVFLAEIEYTEARMTQIRLLKRARSVIIATLKRTGMADEVMTGKISQISDVAPYENISTITIQIDRLT